VSSVARLEEKIVPSCIGEQPGLVDVFGNVRLARRNTAHTSR